MQSQKQWDQALEHYLKSGTPDRAAELVIDVREELRDAGRWQTLGQWLDMLPEKSYSSHPHLIWIKGTVVAAAQFDDQIEALTHEGVHAAFNYYAEAGTGFAEHAYGVLEQREQKNA